MNYRVAAWPRTSLVRNVIFCENKHIYREQSDASRRALDTWHDTGKWYRNVILFFSRHDVYKVHWRVVLFTTENRMPNKARGRTIVCRTPIGIFLSQYFQKAARCCARQDTKNNENSISEAIQCRIRTRMQAETCICYLRLFWYIIYLYHIQITLSLYL